MQEELIPSLTAHSHLTALSRTFSLDQAVHNSRSPFSMAIYLETSERLRIYLEGARLADDWNGPRFRPTSAGRDPQALRRQLHPDRVD